MTAAATPAPAHGIPDAAIDFYAGLEADNSRTYWDAHRDAYERDVRAPMTRLLDALSGEFGTPKLFRPHRDVRFSADKSPYKTHQGGYVAVGDGIGYYVQVSAAGLMVAAGWWRGQGQQLARYREAVTGPAGSPLERLLSDAVGLGYAVDGERLKRAPRGVAPDAPRVDLLRYRTLGARRDHGEPEWLATPELLDVVRADWRALTPLCRWLLEVVGDADDEARLLVTPPGPPG